MQAGVVETLLVSEISNYAFIGAGSSMRITLTNVTVLSKYILIFIMEKSAQIIKFSIKNFFSKCDQIRSFQILNGKLHFLYSEISILNTCLFSRKCN